MNDLAALSFEDAAVVDVAALTSSDPQPSVAPASALEHLLAPIQAFLGCPTPTAWVDAARHHIPELLQDHANCEKKAAGTGMALIFKYSQHFDLQQKLAQLVREEMLHYEQVLQIMQRRGQVWQSVSAARYAAGLRQAIRTHEPATLIDALIVGALVEARSCERFAALIPVVDDELARFYRYLLKSEARHFQDYLTLAQTLSPVPIEARITELVALEANLIESIDLGPVRFHSGRPA